MLIDYIIDSCARRYHDTACTKCSYSRYCPHDCGQCLHFIHSPQIAPAPRKYDCQRMADYYICKYANKYTSELYYAFKQHNSIIPMKKLQVLSIGSGPCTDLLALDMLHQNNIYSFDELEYRGIDINTRIWKNEINDLKGLIPKRWRIMFANADVCKVTDKLIKDSWRPNLIVLQYVFSDMRKNNTSNDIQTFIKGLAEYIDTCPDNTYVVCNDINLSIAFQGGREYFDKLLNAVHSYIIYAAYHFRNNNKTAHYEYGTEYRDNSLICSPPKSAAFTSPYLSCSSAQLIMKKVSKDDYQRQ